jgi:hypothetical protein
MAGVSAQHEALLRELTRRSFLRRASVVGLAAYAGLRVSSPARAGAATPPLATPATDAVLQAFADTMVPGRRIARTESGAPIDPLAIAGVDPLPGGVEADALKLYHHPESGFDALEAPFITDLEARSLAVGGGEFLHLGFDARVRVCLSGLDFSNPERVVWEAAAAMPFIAFCAATLVPAQTAAKSVGYAVMGLPGKAPNGYRHFSYRRRLSRERTVTGSLP